VFRPIEEPVSADTVAARYAGFVSTSSAYEEWATRPSTDEHVRPPRAPACTKTESFSNFSTRKACAGERAVDGRSTHSSRRRSRSIELNMKNARGQLGTTGSAPRSCGRGSVVATPRAPTRSHEALRNQHSWQRENILRGAVDVTGGEHSVFGKAPRWSLGVFGCRTLSDAVGRCRTLSGEWVRGCLGGRVGVCRGRVSKRRASSKAPTSMAAAHGLRPYR
jgi:hypothetical protein